MTQPSPSPALTDGDQTNTLIRKAMNRARLEASSKIDLPDGRTRYEPGFPEQTLYGQLATAIAILRARATAAEKKQAEDRAWYEMTVSVVEEQRENYRAKMKASETRATAAEAERDKLRTDLAAAMVEISTQAQARGEAEGRLRASEVAGVVEGWRERAAAAEAALLEKDGEIKRLREAVKPFADVCDAEHMRWIKDEQVLELSTRAEVPVSEKLRGRDFRAARAAVAPTDPLPARDEASR